MTTPAIALVTCDFLPALTDSDRVLAAALERRGLAAVPAVWTDPAVDWSGFALVVIRSPWDYFLRIDEFLAWLDRVEATGVPIANPPAVLRWNAHKHYLRELEARGAPLPPSLWLDRGSRPDLRHALAERGWPRVVIKPAVSGGAHDTWVATVPLDAASEARVAAMLARGDVLVQPFLDVVPREGEISLLFVEGRFTHAVRKRARDGDFRVQAEHGGTFAPELVSGATVQAAAGVLALTPEPTLYGRVDVVTGGEGFMLMELEVVEPDLFLTTHPAAADTLADAIERRVGRPAPLGA